VALDLGPLEETRGRRDPEGAALVWAARLWVSQVPEFRDLETQASLAGRLTWSWINLLFTLMGASSTYPAYQKRDQGNQQDGSNNPKASASPPSGVPVIATSTAEQKHQKNN
jgi:hypothetical protein